MVDFKSKRKKNLRNKSFRLRTLLLGLILVVGTNVWAQTMSVSGKVLEADTNQPFPGATIIVKGTTNGTISDIDGNYSLTNVPEDGILIFSFIGMESQEVAVAGKSVINISLKSETIGLDEVVAVGYGTMKKSDLTGSVASVRSDDIVAMPVADVSQAMQGKMAGVSVTSQDGRPGAEVSIKIRGGGSISQSNDPLILIDGVSGSLSDIPADQIQSIDVLKDASSTAIYGARGANGVIMVTTKSAKAGKVTVSYNGYVKVNTPVKYLDALDPYDYLSYVWAKAKAYGDDYSDPFEKLFGLGSNYSSLNSGGIESYKGMSSDDIQKDVYNSSTSMNHDFTLSAGTEKTKVIFSANYMDEDGMKINSYSKRASVALKVDQKILDNLSVNFDTRFIDDRAMGDEGTTNGEGSILSSSYRFRPISTAHILGDTDALTEGNIENYGQYYLWDRYSPVARLKDYEPLEIDQKLRSKVALSWDIFKNLTFNSTFSLKKTWSEDKEWSGAIYNNYMDDSTGEKLYAGAVEYTKSNSWGLRWANTLNYKWDINVNSNLNLLVGNEFTNSGGNKLKISADHFPSNFTKETAFAMIDQYDSDAGTASFSSSVSTPSRIVSYFTRANYSLLNKYLITFTFRADGSSKFSPSNKWGYFPAGAIAWRMNEEAFMGDISWLDNLKLRLSYGAVGNDNIDSDQWSTSWSSESSYKYQYVVDNEYQSAYDLTNSEMANEDLKWETTITRDLGVDFAIFNSRLTGTVDYYWNTTKDLLMLTTIPAITGFTETYANIGQTSNKGIEISLNGTIFRNSDWNISAGFNINFNKNNIDELSDNVTGLYTTNWASSSTYVPYDYVLKEGKPVGQIRGLIYDGFYTTDDFNYSGGVYTLKDGVTDSSNALGTVYGVDSDQAPADQAAFPGFSKFKDLNDDGTIDEDDIGIIGDTNPIHTGGFNVNVTYKNIDFGAFFNWSYGNDVYNVTKLSSVAFGYKEDAVYENQLACMKNSYKIYDVVDGEITHLTTPDELDAANTNANLPLAYQENGITSTLGIEDGSFLRLNTLTLGYSLPKSVIEKFRMSRLRVYGSIYNVFTITGYDGLDPEVSANTSQNSNDYPTSGLDWGAYPRARSFVVGLNVNF